jgi:hypothetical protein
VLVGAGGDDESNHLIFGRELLFFLHFENGKKIRCRIKTKFGLVATRSSAVLNLKICFETFDLFLEWL